MPGLDGPKRRNLPITQPFFGDRTTRVERAAARRIEGARNITFEQQSPFARRGVELGGRAQKSLSVRMTRARVDLLGRRQLDHAPQVHDRNATAHVLHEVQVMSDEHVTQPELILKIAKQVDDLGLETSSALTGSSATMKLGETARARAIPMRCRCPPENSCG